MSIRNGHKPSHQILPRRLGVGRNIPLALGVAARRDAFVTNDFIFLALIRLVVYFPAYQRAHGCTIGPPDKNTVQIICTRQ